MTTPLLADTDRAGPYRLPANRQAAVLADAAALAIPLIRLGGPSAADAPAWLAEAGCALSLPAHFGANFDALYDSLCDRDVLPASALLLLIGNTQALGEEGTDTLIAVLQAAADEWREQGRRLWALFETPGLDLDPLPAR